MATLESTQERTRSEIADYLREFADELDPSRGGDSSGRTGDAGGRTTDTGPRDANARDRNATGADAGTDTGGRDVDDKVTVIMGNESATINPSQTCTFDVAIDTESDLLDTGEERSASFTIRWSGEHVEADDELDVK